MHTSMNLTVARAIVDDRVREAEHARLVRAVRAGRRTTPAEAGATPSGPVARRWSRRLAQVRVSLAR